MKIEIEKPKRGYEEQRIFEKLPANILENFEKICLRIFQRNYVLIEQANTESEIIDLKTDNEILERRLDFLENWSHYERMLKKVNYFEEFEEIIERICK